MAGKLSALLANDPGHGPILVSGCSRRGWDPVPFLLTLAIAALWVLA